MSDQLRAKETQAIAARIVMPNETNTLGNLMGGQLLNWMDINSAISAHRLCKRIVVTASVNNVSFNKAIKLGDIVTLESFVTRSFSSSMEVHTKVWVEHHQTGKKIPCNESYFTFVAVDQLGSPIKVPALLPETSEEKEHFNGALRRRQLSLILAGRMEPSEATELKALFIDK
ncbi:MAG: acyl-CoA thioesterase [Flavobacteriaceae bacterium]|nr:acyl-CoA thioesterase [Flavobacteriales bacterium]RZV54302.1 MAG: acyl-CoA thioesterase [Flavobacteriaceae bacterium]